MKKAALFCLLMLSLAARAAQTDETPQKVQAADSFAAAASGEAGASSASADAASGQAAPDVSGTATDGAADEELDSAAFAMVHQIPCPTGWIVSPNPSTDNSLAYMTDDGQLAVSVTSITSKQGSGVPTEAESYARVAAEQMGCSIPVGSNFIEGGWTFECKDFEVEGVVYGDPGELVLLGISGRSAKTEPSLNEFVRFLQYQAKAD
ncbi:MAG: hypothetical protein SPL30_04625 [Succinivibrio sp.]|nr:hypothetical protein [Succinivibrio sp.]